MEMPEPFQGSNTHGSELPPPLECPTVVTLLRWDADNTGWDPSGSVVQAAQKSLGIPGEAGCTAPEAEHGELCLISQLLAVLPAKPGTGYPIFPRQMENRQRLAAEGEGHSLKTPWDGWERQS